MSTRWPIPGLGRSEHAEASWWLLEAAHLRRVDWLWPDRVPLGKMTLLIGDPGRGKSLVGLDMAARVTRGLPWPDACLTLLTAAGGCATQGPIAAAPSPCEARDRSAKLCAPLGRVVLLSAEDDAADTILPRLKAAGGDPERVVILHSLEGRRDRRRLSFSLARDMSLLDDEMQARGDVRLVILDPVTAYLGGLHGNSNAEVRDLLAPVRELAERHRAAVLGVSHLTKKRDVALIYRAMGSLAFVAASRAVWAVGADRSEPGRMLLLPVKCNLLGGATGLAFRIQGSAGDPSVPVVAWEPQAVTEAAEEALGATRRAPAVELAAMWLRGLLAAGPRASRDVERLAAAAGVSPTALRKARKALGVEGCHGGTGNAWALQLPGREATGPEVSDGPPAAAGAAEEAPVAAPAASPGA